MAQRVLARPRKSRRRRRRRRRRTEAKAESKQAKAQPQRSDGPHNIQLCSGIRIFTHPEAARSWAFDDEELLRNDPDQAARRAILSPLNVNATEHGQQLLQYLTGDLEKLLAAEELTEGDRLALEDTSLTSPEYLALIHEEGVPDHEIALKVGAVIITVRSLSAHAGVLNGARLVVTHVPSESFASNKNAHLA
jgi:hypothetical protein